MVSLLTALRDSLQRLADPEGRVALNNSLTATSLTEARRAADEAVGLKHSDGMASLGRQLGAKDKERELDRLRHEAEVKKLHGEIEKLKSELGEP